MITVVGSLNLDLVVRVQRMPEPGETVLAHDYAEHPGGKGANQAVAAARVGGDVAMVGRIGRDEAGARLTSGLEADGVNVAEVRAVDVPTGRALIEVDDAGENRIVVVPGANARWAAADLPAASLERADIVLLQREVPDDVVARAIHAVERAGGRSVLNLAPAGAVESDVLRRLSILVVNESEAAFLLDDRAAAEVGDAPEDAARRLAEKVAGDAVITLGARGAVHAGRGGRGRVDGYRVPVVDTTAAGDAFAGALATMLDEGRDLGRALRFACAAGACAVTRPGAQPSLPRRDEVDALVGGSA